MSADKVVFTNGCFDILHRGHLTYLRAASELGNMLVIGINSDTSVKRLKGSERPINNQADRKFFLENLKWVHEVHIFDEDTPLNLIKKLTPDILVKGGDWSIDQIVGAEHVIENGGEVKSLSFIDGYSTTSIIDKIRQ